MKQQEKIYKNIIYTDQPYTILIVEVSGSAKYNVLLKLINHQQHIDKIFLFTKNPWVAYNIESIEIFRINKDFDLKQDFLYNFLCQTVVIFPILFIKMIEAFWSRDITITSIWVLKHFEPKV